MFPRLFLLSLILLLARVSLGCDLCAIYNADTAGGQSGHGFSLNVSEQFIPYRDLQRDGHELPPSDATKMYLDKSMTHIAPTWNFSPMFGVSLSLPVIYQSFQQLLLIPTLPFVETRSDEEAGIGDLSLIGRCTFLRINKGEAALTATVLAGVKFPTGDASRLEEEVELTKALDALYGPGHQHAIGGVHLSDLAFGSGSYDGVFGATVNSRWARIFCNAQFQYYLRTPGEAGYQYGDEWVISGGPGLFLVLKDSFTFSAQILGVYDQEDPDILLGRENQNTGMTAIYLGPLFFVSIGERFSANAGIDLPVRIQNNGLQDVPDWRVHAGLAFRF